MTTPNNDHLGLLELLALERIDANIFRGQSQDIGTKQVFGGQVLGQALQAAQATIEQREAHSLHAYFLRKGDFNAPIIYEVEHSREGRSFAARRVVAIQHGRPIFILSASFQVEEHGLDYQSEFTPPSRADGIKLQVNSEQRKPSDKLAQFFDARIIAPQDATSANHHQAWAKLRGDLTTGDAMHRSILAYVSDLGLLMSTLLPHGIQSGSKAASENFIIASIDHGMWFHRPFRVDQWFFYRCMPLSTSNSRGLARGEIYDERGCLIASTIQEGLIRPIDSPN